MHGLRLVLESHAMSRNILRRKVCLRVLFDRVSDIENKKKQSTTTNSEKGKHNQEPVRKQS